MTTSRSVKSSHSKVSARVFFIVSGLLLVFLVTQLLFFTEALLSSWYGPLHFVWVLACGAIAVFGMCGFTSTKIEIGRFGEEQQDSGVGRFLQFSRFSPLAFLVSTYLVTWGVSQVSWGLVTEELAMPTLWGGALLVLQVVFLFGAVVFSVVHSPRWRKATFEQE